MTLEQRKEETSIRKERYLFVPRIKFVAVMEVKSFHLIVD